MDMEERKKERRKKNDSIDDSEDRNDSDYTVEYDRDIIHDKLMKRIESLIINEPDLIKNSFKLIETIKFDRKKEVSIDGQEYNCKYPF